MKSLHRKIISIIIENSIEKTRQSPKQMLNLFNTGIVIDLKKTKIVAMNLVERIVKGGEKKSKW